MLPSSSVLFTSSLLQINGAGRPSSSASSDYTTTDGLRGLSSGTLISLIRKRLHWPLHVGRTLFGTPRQLARWTYKAARAVGLHLRERQEDYVFLYELLSLGVPFIYVLHEMTGQMSREAIAPSPVSMMESVEPYWGLQQS